MLKKPNLLPKKKPLLQKFNQRSNLTNSLQLHNLSDKPPPTKFKPNLQSNNFNSLRYLYL